MPISSRIKRAALTAVGSTLTMLNNLQTANAQPENRHTCYKLPDGRFDVLYCEPPELETQRLSALQQQCGVMIVPLNTSECGGLRLEQYFYYGTLAPGSKCELGSERESGPGSCIVNVLKVNETGGAYAPQSPLPNGPSTDEGQMSLTSRIIFISTLVLIMTLAISVTVGIIFSRKNRNKKADQSSNNAEAGLNRQLLDRNAPPSNYGHRSSAVAFKPAPAQATSETIKRAHEALENNIFEL